MHFGVKRQKSIDEYHKMGDFHQIIKGYIQPYKNKNYLQVCMCMGIKTMIDNCTITKQNIYMILYNEEKL